MTKSFRLPLRSEDKATNVKYRQQQLLLYKDDSDSLVTAANITDLRMTSQAPLSRLLEHTTRLVALDVEACAAKNKNKNKKNK